MARREWKLTKATKLYKECRRYIDIIESGYILSIDPSCGSSSSMPGYAIYRGGKLKESGTIEIVDTGRDLPYRLQDLLHSLQTQFDSPDLLVTEAIAPRRFGGGGATGHASLLRSTGVVYSAYHKVPVLSIRPQSWRLMKPPGWKKTDEWDAIALGHCAIEVCKLIREGEVSG